MSYLEIYLFGIFINFTLDTLMGIIVFACIVSFVGSRDQVQLGKFMLEMDKINIKLFKLKSKIILLFFIPFSSIITFIVFMYNTLRYGSINGLFKYKLFLIKTFK